MADGSTPIHLPPDGDDLLVLEDAPARKKAGKRKELTRETELAHDLGKESDKIHEKLIKLYSDIEEGFVNQGPRSDDQLENWDCYDCELGGGQAYNGNAQIYVPLIRNAVDARKTRFVNQLFPKGGRYVEVVSSDGEQPYGETALLEYYVRKAKLRTEVAPALVANGDNEGQYNVYVSWSSVARHVTWRERKPVEVMGAALEGLEDEETIEKDVILDEHPIVEVLADADVLILPVTCNSVEEALEIGGSVTIIRRWTKAQLEDMKDNDEIVETEGEDLIESMAMPKKANDNDVPKKHADAAGIKSRGPTKICLGYETWKKIKVRDEMRLCKVLYGGDKIVLSCRLNPMWSDRCPLISVPVRKIAGVVKGVAPVAACTKMQYAANDALNEGMDSATYALLPIVMTDPAKNPKVNTMILDLAAVWETSPTDTKFAQFPDLWKGSFEIVAAFETQVFKTLSVSPAMIAQSTGGKGGKRNQSEVALEQQVEILSTSDAVTVLEDGVFTPILERFAEMDAQFRNSEITVKKYGYLGMMAEMERVPPLQMGHLHQFVWYGVEQARNAAQAQQQIAFLNVLRGIPPTLLPGRRINMTAAIEQTAAAVLGPRIAPLVFEDLTKKFTYPPELENEVLKLGQKWPVSPQDDDAKHIEVHMQEQQKTGDAAGTIRQHINEHRMSQIMKAQQAQQAQGQPGAPGGAGPGIAGQPKPGAQPANPRQGKQPPGAIAPDQLARAGAPQAPRR